MTQQSPLLGTYPEKNKKIHASQCSLQHCLQWPRHGSNLNVYWRKNGKGRCSILIQWDISHQNEWNNAICSNTDGPSDCHTEWSQTEKKQHRTFLICGFWNEMTQRHLLTKQKETHRERTYGCQRGNTGGRDSREFGMDMCRLLFLKWITKKDRGVAHGTLFNVTWQPGQEGSLEQIGFMSMYDWGPLLFTWNYHNIVNLYPSTK